MKTIIHHGAKDGWHNASIRCDNWDEYDQLIVEYTLGYRAPNYPVPATIETAVYRTWCQGGSQAVINWLADELRQRDELRMN